MDIVYVKEEIKKLREYAISKGFDKVIFRNRPTSAGDFCIFLYSKKINERMKYQNVNSYTVGFDGNWVATDTPELSFNACLGYAYDFINKHSN